jgi:hypothetical protein
LSLHKNQCDVGVDQWNYKPVKLERLLEKMEIVDINKLREEQREIAKLREENFKHMVSLYGFEQ